MFGSNFFLFAWTNDLAVYFITKGISSLSFITHVLFTLILLYTGRSTTYGLLVALDYAILAYFLEMSAWNYGVNAVRHIDPTWNVHRGKLYPPIFYS